jgi:hypothetical protein
MSDMTALRRQIQDMRETHAPDQVLPLLQQYFAQLEAVEQPDKTDLFVVMFEWQLLLEQQYAPARAALVTLREQQIARLLAGCRYLGCGISDKAAWAAAPWLWVERQDLVVQMNELLGDPDSSGELLAKLEAEQPEHASRLGRRAIPALIAIEDYARAERYLGEPLAMLDAVNESARTLPWLPPPGVAPRLTAETCNLATSVRHAVVILRGTGREKEAQDLRAALLSGLESDVLRAAAERELDEPGAIIRMLVDHQVQQEQQDQNA